MRKCNTCHVDKESSEFYRDKQIKATGGFDYICKSCKKEYRKTLKIEYKKYHLLNTYGITLEQYLGMFNDQGGSCLICSVHRNTLPKDLHVDHCHETGQVRGLLCSSCNQGLGNFKDSIKSLENAISYLKGHKPNLKLVSRG